MNDRTSRSMSTPPAALVIATLVAWLGLSACSGGTDTSAGTSVAGPAASEKTLPTGLADDPTGDPALPTTPDGDDAVDFGDPSTTTAPSTTTTSTTVVVEPDRPVSLDSDVAFAAQSAVLTKAGVAEIEAFLATIDIDAVTSVVVAAHTDHRGSESYNLELSADRASAVADVLVDNGIDRDLIDLDPRGETFAHPAGATEAQMRSDRRVDITVHVP